MTTIPERARDARHQIAEIVRAHGGAWNGAMDAAIDDILRTMLRAAARYPNQPIVSVARVLRFRQNAIVRHLLDNGPFDLNDLAQLPFSDDDRAQFAQLIGYSVAGWSDLPYVSDEAYARATER